jgi:hypothetical protein
MKNILKELKQDVLLNQSIKDYYTSVFPSDDLGKELPLNITFYDIFNALDNYSSVYSLMGNADDSIIRERLFERLAILIEVDYDYIYNQWMKCEC